MIQEIENTSTIIKSDIPEEVNLSTKPVDEPIIGMSTTTGEVAETYIVKLETPVEVQSEVTLFTRAKIEPVAPPVASSFKQEPLLQMAPKIGSAPKLQPPPFKAKVLMNEVVATTTEEKNDVQEIGTTTNVNDVQSLDGNVSATSTEATSSSNSNTSELPESGVPTNIAVISTDAVLSKIEDSASSDTGLGQN